MGARSFMDKVKNGLNIGAVHRWLFGENAQEQDWDSMLSTQVRRMNTAPITIMNTAMPSSNNEYSPTNHNMRRSRYAPPQQQQTPQYGQQDMQHYQQYPQANQYAQASYNPSYNTPRESDYTPPSFKANSPQGLHSEVAKRNRGADQHRVEPQENLVQFPQENAVSVWMHML